MTSMKTSTLLVGLFIPACSHYLEEQQDNTAGHLEHLLATREQELRALLAAKESLNAQNRQTWILLEERTHENSQLQVGAVT